MLENNVYQKELLEIITSSSMEKKFINQAIDSDIKRYEEIRKLSTGQDEDYTTGCLLDYDYHYTLIAVDLRRQKELDQYTQAIQQIELVGQLKNADDDYNATNADGTQIYLF